MLSSICLCTVSFDLTQRLSALRRSRFSLQNCSGVLTPELHEPGGRFPLTDCALAERGVLVKNGAKLFTEITD